MLANCYDTLAIIAMANIILSMIALFSVLADPYNEPNWMKWPVAITIILWPIIGIVFIILKIIEVWI